jgi:parvulin-like peptidyl-prolyl isomerase
MPSRFVAVALTVVLAIVAGASARLGKSAAAPAAGLVVASVNGARISEMDLRVRLSELLPMASYHGNIEPGKLLALKRAALDQLVLDELVIQEACASGLAPDQRLVEQRAQALRSRFASAEAFQEALAASGLTERAFRSYLERAVLVGQAQDAHVPADPSGDEIEAYYRRNAAKFVRPDQVRLFELTVAVDPAGGRAAERAASARTRTLLARLKGGADFGQLAWDESADAYRVKNGDVGWVHRGRLDPDLEAAAFAAPLNQYRTARSLSGFHILKVTAREPERQLSFEEARNTIAERVRRERRESVEREWHRRLLSGARVEILDPALARAIPIDIPRDPGAMPGTPASATAMVAASSH